MSFKNKKNDLSRFESDTNNHNPHESSLDPFEEFRKGGYSPFN
jgi:hypothetical protein